jgi:hypothetical protein
VRAAEEADTGEDQQHAHNLFHAAQMLAELLQEPDKPVDAESSEQERDPETERV